jgi:orotidine-5'-phosphate decarboxylase
MNYQKLVDLTKKRKSFLCVGLDPDPDLVRPEKIYDFNRKIIDQTRDYAIAYKPNIAFYENMESWLNKIGLVK